MVRLQRFVLFCIFCVASLSPKAQQPESNWDAYVMQINQKPVSIVVDLGLAAGTSTRERPFLILFRTKIAAPDEQGMPVGPEVATLDGLEESLITALKKSNGALYTGRFTQRGLREYCFYALDTVDYIPALQSVMKKYPGYEWLSQARLDAKWSHYHEVLYPSPVEMERIQNRRVVDQLKSGGDALKTPRRIDHFFGFRTPTGRDSFLRNLPSGQFKMEPISESPAPGDYPYKLQLFRDDTPDYSLISRLLIPLWEQATKYQGIYEGWETRVVK